MQNFRKLVVWQLAHEIAVEICRFAASMPPRYVRLADQLIGACTSVPANLAEGCGRHTSRERARFYDFAAGSASELEALLLIVRDIDLMGPLDADRFCRRIGSVRAMIHALLRKLRPTRSRDSLPHHPSSEKRRISPPLAPEATPLPDDP